MLIEMIKSYTHSIVMVSIIYQPTRTRLRQPLIIRATDISYWNGCTVRCSTHFRVSFFSVWSAQKAYWNRTWTTWPWTISITHWWWRYLSLSFCWIRYWRAEHARTEKNILNSGENIRFILYGIYTIYIGTPRSTNHDYESTCASLIVQTGKQLQNTYRIIQR